MSIENPYPCDPDETITVAEERLHNIFNDAIKAVYDWGNEPCMEPDHFIEAPFDHKKHWLNMFDIPHYLFRKDCPACWEELKGK